MLVSRRSSREGSGVGGCGVTRFCAAHYYGASPCGSSSTPTSPLASFPSISAGGGWHSSSPSPPSPLARPSYNPAPVSRQRSSSSASSVGVSGGSSGGSSQMVAIDSKIEQAMDLVKTHLMFAVREEVELLRGRIVDLESAVGNLEAENAVLRQHVSDEILRNLSINS